ncbi:MAG: MmgE/PrpD family protein [Fuscovulum sp.]|nr:MAG: MmgE/PrpD family protein [Fuscovulum sp.]
MSLKPPSGWPTLYRDPFSGDFAMHLIDFLHGLRWQDVPAPVQDRTRDFLVDLLGVAAGGIGTRLSRIIRDHAADQFAPGSAPARMILDGRAVSPAGATLAGGMTIDAYDAHDGHRLTKGHAGCAALPAAMAMAEATAKLDGGDLMVSLLLGYEIGTRAGIALHRTACDYHTSGAWTALSCAVIGARYLGLTADQTGHALGIAEYHGPRSQMMRCIDHPTMLKDGSGWGGMAGVSAAYLARSGFTGAPAVTADGADVADLWGDLGQTWRVMEQYYKPFPVCRWAQPPVQAVLSLMQGHGLRSTDVARIEIVTFHQSLRLATRTPSTTEEAQYSTAFPAAVAAVRGTIGAADITEAAFADPEIRRLSEGMVVTESDAYNAAFPARRFAHAVLVLQDGTRLESPPTEARGDPEAMVSRDEMHGKFHACADPVLGAAKAIALRKAAEGLGHGQSIESLLDLAVTPV